MLSLGSNRASDKETLLLFDVLTVFLSSEFRVKVDVAVLL